MGLIVLTFFISLLSSIVSGISGGGGALILTPYYIFIGLSPQQAIATGKFVGLGVMTGSLAAFRGKGLVRRGLLIPLMSLTIVTSFLAAWLIPKINTGLFQVVIGILLVILIPVIFINKTSWQPGARTGKWLWLGYCLYALISFAQGVFGTGLAMFLTLILMLLFGLTALEANATKRVAQSLQTVLLFILLFFQGLVVLTYGFATLFGSLIGSYVGSRLAIKKGERFVKYALALTMAISGLALIFSA